RTSGRRQPFVRRKLVAGVSAAAKGRPVTVEQSERLAEEVEDDVRVGARSGEITTVAIGHAVLDRLRHLDEVAYLRFASVYKGFDGVADFHRELVLLEKLQSV